MSWGAGYERLHGSDGDEGDWVQLWLLLRGLGTVLLRSEDPHMLWQMRCRVILFLVLVEWILGNT